jgi:hypothetical protein
VEEEFHVLEAKLINQDFIGIYLCIFINKYQIKKYIGINFFKFLDALDWHVSAPNKS